MAKAPKVVRTVPALRRALQRPANAASALVPTMGALHAGHLALVRMARRKARRVIVSIYVNPTQFGPQEDFSTYPRSFRTDLRALADEKVDLVWAPTSAVMYPDGFATTVTPGGAAKAGLEDKFRPHFFGGVATVVAKLLTQCSPDFALFGEKDYQQLCVITQMARDLDLPVKIVGVPTVRERNGLAMSSRNVNLSAEERNAAPVLYRVLKASAKRIGRGEDIAGVLDQGRTEISAAGFALDYLEARHTLTLAPVERRGQGPNRGPIRILVAAKIGRTRLIDNIGV